MPAPNRDEPGNASIFHDVEAQRRTAEAGETQPPTPVPTRGPERSRDRSPHRRRKDNTPADLRNRALIAILFRAGLRITEALALRPIDLDPRNGAIRILHAKGGRSRTVGMDAVGFEILDRWLQARTSLPVGDGDALFCLVNGKPMASCYVRVFLPRIAKKAGILRRVHAHGFRHTHAAELRGEGVDIGVISKQLGHRSIATTARYLDHIAPWDVVKAMRRRAWGSVEGQETSVATNCR